MIKKITLVLIIFSLGLAFWYSTYLSFIITGIAIFLFGMSGLENGFKAFTGGKFASLLFHATRSQNRSFLFGLTSTILFQSSTLISLISISFLSANLIGLSQSIGIVFGSNIGSAISTWVIANIGISMQLAKLAFPFMAIGIFFWLRKEVKIKHFGQIILSLGFLLLGIDFIKQGFELSNTASNYSLLENYTDTDNILYKFMYLSAGFLLTILLQSSHALLILLITALNQEQINYHFAIYACIGSNLGTTITTIIGSLHAVNDAKRLALAQVLFKLTASIIILFLLPWFIQLNNYIAEALQLESNIAIKLALFHILFNVSAAICFLPFTKTLSIGLKKLFITAQEKKLTIKTQLPTQHHYLSKAILYSPDATLRVLQREMCCLYTHAMHLISFGLYMKKEQLLFTAKNKVSLKDVIESWPKVGLSKLYKYYIKKNVITLDNFATELKDINDLTQQQKAQLSSYELISRNFSYAVKNMRRLRKSLKKAIIGSNEEVQLQYEAMRKIIATTMGELECLYTSVENSKTSIIKTTEKLKDKLRQHDNLFSCHIDQLIKENKITTHHAITLMHDYGYMNSICIGLITGITILLLNKEEYYPNTKEDDLPRTEALNYLNDLITQSSINEERVK